MRAPAVRRVHLEYGRPIAPACTHSRSIQYSEPPSEVAGCEECLASGMQWVHLRMCQSCGHIGCCDNSEGKHATAHYRESGHPIVRSAEPGETGAGVTSTR